MNPFYADAAFLFVVSVAVGALCSHFYYDWKRRKSLGG